MDAACYLVHSMRAGRGFHGRYVRAAAAWYAPPPVHKAVFSGMIARLAREV